MKVSEIKDTDIYQHLREYEDNFDDAEKKSIITMKAASIGYVKSFTGLNESDLDKHEEITIAVLVLIADMWDNRSMTVDKSKVNIVVENILSMHSTNLLPSSKPYE